MIENLSFSFNVDPNVNVIDSSKYKDYITCERMFFYSHVLGWKPDRPEIHLVFGSAWHKAMETFWTHGYEAVEEAFNAFLDYFTGEFPDSDQWEEFHPKTPQRALMALVAYSYFYKNVDSKYTPALFNSKPLIEIGGKITLTEQTDLAFKMDIVLEDQFRRVRARDWKSGSPWRGWEEQWETAPQSSCYHHVLYCTNLPDKIDGIEFDGVLFKKTVPCKIPKHPEDCLRHFELKRSLIYKTKKQMNLWYYLMTHRLNMMRKDFELLSQSTENDPVLIAFPCREHSCHNFYGRTCAYLDFCLHWNNPLQKLGEPPLGFKEEHWNPLEEESKINLEL